MSNQSTDILKKAILLERRGRAFYETVAEQTDNEDVKKIFDIMAEEEKLHEEFLSKQFKYVSENNSFQASDLESHGKEEESIANTVLNDDMLDKISSSGFEAAAISAAIDMETKAIEIYAKRAEEATDENEKKLFEWLADWERGHHKLLNELNKQLTEKIWNDNSFWPF